MEVVKQRRQTSRSNKSSLKIMLNACKSEGFVKVRVKNHSSFNHVIECLSWNVVLNWLTL